MSDLSTDGLNMWWERRREHERTYVYIARVMRELGLEVLAANAEALHYDEYFCPPQMPWDGFNIQHLVFELRMALREHPAKRDEIQDVINAVKVGEFDCTREESQLWANSVQGREAFAALVRGE